MRQKNLEKFLLMCLRSLSSNPRSVSLDHAEFKVISRSNIGKTKKYFDHAKTTWAASNFFVGSVFLKINSNFHIHLKKYNEIFNMEVSLLSSS